MRIVSRYRHLFILLTAILAATICGVAGHQQASKANFDRQYPGFVESNEKILRMRLKQPPSLARRDAIKAVHDNLAWAAEYKRLGFDPEIFAEIAFEKELAKSAKHNEFED